MLNLLLMSFRRLTLVVCIAGTRHHFRACLCAWRQIATLIWWIQVPRLSLTFLSPICSCSPRGIVDHRADCWLLHRKNSEAAGHPSRGQTDVQVTCRGSEWQFCWVGERVEGSQVMLKMCVEMRETSILQQSLTKMEKLKSSFPITCLPLMRAKWCSPQRSQKSQRLFFFFYTVFWLFQVMRKQISQIFPAQG